MGATKLGRFGQSGAFSVATLLLEVVNEQIATIKCVSNQMEAGRAEKISALKKPYSKPVLKKFGSVTDLTRGRFV